MVAIDEQSPDISQGVSHALEVRTDVNDDDVLDEQGAGDQGMMFGFACTETPELMPLPISLAHKLARRLADVRKAEILPYLRPDGKSQVTVRYEGGKPVEIVKVVLASQHAESADLQSIIYPDLLEHVVEPILPKGLYDASRLEEITVINATGKFVVGGPMGDCGLTGRKIVVDTYGGAAPHGGGAFSGKDPSKVDRSGAYAARYVAKNVVAAGLAERCELQVAYAIGVAHPVSRDGRLPGHREGRPSPPSSSSSTSTSTCARRRSFATSICAGRSTRRRPPTAISAATTTTSRGSAPTRPQRCAPPPASRAEPLRRAKDGGVSVSYAAVFPLVRTRAFAGAFDYSVPPELVGKLEPGALVAVQLGSQTVIGVVLELRSTTAHEGRVLPVRDLLDVPSIPADLLELAREVESYYLTSFAAALSLVCPPTGALKVVRQYELTADGRAAREAGEEGLDEVAGLKLPAGPLTKLGERYRRKGWVRIAYRVHVAGATRAGRALRRGGETPPRLGPRQRAALELVEQSAVLDERALRAATGLSLPALRRLLEAGALVDAAAEGGGEAERRVASGTGGGAEPAAPPPVVAQAARLRACAALGDVPDLLPEQRHALHAILCAGAPRR